MLTFVSLWCQRQWWDGSRYSELEWPHDRYSNDHHWERRKEMSVRIQFSKQPEQKEQQGRKQEWWVALATESNSLNVWGKVWGTRKKKAFSCQVVPLWARLCWVCQIIQTPGWHGWVRELAHNEGDVPQLLPVSDSSLNQEWREKSTLLAHKSSLLSRQMWVCIVCVCVLVRAHGWFCIFSLISYTQTVCDMRPCTHAWLVDLSVTAVEPTALWAEMWTFCLSVSAFTDPLPPGCSSSSHDLSERTCQICNVVGFCCSKNSLPEKIRPAFAN